MTQDVLSRYTRTIGGDDDSPESPLRDAAEDFVAFGWVRGMRGRANMLELHKRTGHILAVGYAWVERVEFDPADALTLHLHGQRIRVKGRNLNAEMRPGVRLFEGIVRGRVSWIREADRTAHLENNPRSVLIEEINW